MVFSKSGAAEFLAMALVSASCSAMAVSRAGLKSEIWTRSNGGTPPCGPSHFISNGFSVVESSVSGFIALEIWLVTTNETIIAITASSARLRIIRTRIIRLPQLSLGELLNWLVYWRAEGVVQARLFWVLVQFEFCIETEPVPYSGGVLVSSLRSSAILRVSAVYLFWRFFYRRAAETAELRRECFQIR